MKNIIITDSINNETSLVVCLDSLSLEEVGKFFTKVVGKYDDIFEVKDEEIQYYYIDGRTYIDTPEKVDIVRKKIA